MALEAAIQLVGGKLAPASQPDQPPITHPQQDPHSKHPQYHHNPPQPRNPQGLEQPPTALQERPVENPKQQPPSRSGRDNAQQQRQNKVEQHHRNPRRQTAWEQNPHSRGQHPSEGRRQADSGFAVRGPPRHSNVRGPTDQHRPPPVYRDIPAEREGNSANSRSHTHRSQFRDGHDYNEADSRRRNAGRQKEEGGERQNPPPM
ncbi:transcriptional activator ptaB-like [Humulus lupulus]|uniref:transcriptional activator ptaB-like n=1 Tax=Humulus lupulus TaxID=3486 RepID=UPI002B40D6A7|nr:transcriptional activator ptaB-like [Humulus lupulus]